MIIGSTALQYFGVERREPQDVDSFYWEHAKRPEGEDTSFLPEELYNKLPVVDGYLTPSGVLTLKMSHLQWDIKWNKTLEDILWLKMNKKVPFYPYLYCDLVDHWKVEHGDKSFLSLEKTKEEFFTDGVKYLVDHDDLHEVVAGDQPPMYTRCLKENADVAIDKDKFKMLSFSNKVKMFKEEITVIALERYIIPRRIKVNDYRKAYSLALKKTITNLTKGWASDFIIFNIEHFVEPDHKLFFNAIHMETNEMVEEFLAYMAEQAKEAEYYLDGDSITEFVGDVFARYASADDVTVVKPAECGEGRGENCSAVVEWNGHFFKARWGYYSYDGMQYDYILETIEEVFPKEKVVTVYES